MFLWARGRSIVVLEQFQLKKATSNYPNQTLFVVEHHLIKAAIVNQTGALGREGDRGNMLHGVTLAKKRFYHTWNPNGNVAPLGAASSSSITMVTARSRVYVYSFIHNNQNFDTKAISYKN